MQPNLSRYLQPEVLTRIAQSTLLPRHLVEGTLTGSHKSPLHGFAVEFAGHRGYVPGDDLRYLDWNVYYRHDRQVIKQYEMETNLVCHLMLDVSASMRYGDDNLQKLTYAAQMAITLAYLVVKNSDKISLTIFDDQIRDYLRPSGAMEQLLQMVAAIDRVEPAEKTNFGPTLLDLAARSGRRGIVILLSDFLADPDDLIPGIQRLRYAGHEVVLFQVMHPDEIDFTFPGNVRFLGIEDDRQILTRPADIRESYLDALREHNDRLESICQSNRCERVLCRTSDNMGKIFADYLQRRELFHRRR